MSEDRELKVMATVFSAMEPLEPDERKRVLSWLTQKLSIDVSSGRDSRHPADRATPLDGRELGLSTDTIATIAGAKSGPDLIIAAAAHLHFTQRRQTFGRQDLIAQMRSAPGHFKDTFVNNMSSYLTGLTKSDRLRLVSADTYALSVKERQALEAKLANAG